MENYVSMMMLTFNNALHLQYFFNQGGDQTSACNGADGSYYITLVILLL